MSTDTDTTPEHDDVHERAADAALAVLNERLGKGAPPRDVVADALDAAAHVYDAAHDQAVQDMMDRCGMTGLDIGPDGVSVGATLAREQAVMFAGMAAEFLNENPGAENYVEQTFQVWDDARENRYTVVFEFVRPDKPTPHELRRLAEKQLSRATTILAQTIAALHVMVERDPDRPGDQDETAGCREVLDEARNVYRLLLTGEPVGPLKSEQDAYLLDNVAAVAAGPALLDPREVLLGIGRPPTCSCPGGVEGWRGDFDFDCPRHGTIHVSEDELRELLPAARDALTWAVGAHVGVYHTDPAKTRDDGMLCNVLCAVLDVLRDPARRADRGLPV